MIKSALANKKSPNIAESEARNSFVPISAEAISMIVLAYIGHIRLSVGTENNLYI
jgi:hypothetical protein